MKTSHVEGILNKTRAEEILGTIRRKYRTELETLERAGISGDRLVVFLVLISRKKLVYIEDLQKEAHDWRLEAKSIENAPDWLGKYFHPSAGSVAKELKRRSSAIGKFPSNSHLAWRNIFSINREFDCYAELAQVYKAVVRAHGINEERSHKTIANWLTRKASRYKKAEDPSAVAKWIYEYKKERAERISKRTGEQP